MRPTILTYPWNLGRQNSTVVLAGSYNPPHLGHLAMLQYLSSRFKKVIVVVGFNPSKTYDVTPQERARLLKTMLADAEVKNIRVEVVQGLIWRYAIQNGAQMLVRGIRSWDKDGKEEQHLHYQNTIYPLLLGPIWWPIPTLFLEGKPEYNHISSTLVRDLCKGSKVKQLADLVPGSITEDVMKLYSK